MQITKRKLPVIQEKEVEDLKATVQDQASLIDYLSMMSGIDIPDDEMSEVEDE